MDNETRCCPGSGNLEISGGDGFPPMQHVETIQVFTKICNSLLDSLLV